MPSSFGRMWKSPAKSRANSERMVAYGVATLI
jgi:hypothetical protein